jgi:CRP-like cAMP-binding protein
VSLFRDEIEEKRRFDAHAFLDSPSVAKRVQELKKAEIVYSQGDAAQSVMYLQKGGAKLTVVNELGKEAVVAILGPGDFFGEGCLAGQEDQPHGVLPKMSQETLAEMIGTTRSRVNFFMNKFRKLGFIKYNGGLQINTSLLSVVLHE